MSTTTKKHPGVRGLAWHRSQHYSFFLPIDWHRFALSENQSGAILGPDKNDPLTLFAVTATDLGTEITDDDLDIVAEGFFESVAQLPECSIEMQSQKARFNRIELEAKYTFHDQETIIKRWVRVFYLGTHQIVFAAQGATLEKYDYWVPWFFEAMMTAKVHTSAPEIPG